MAEHMYITIKMLPLYVPILLASFYTSASTTDVGTQDSCFYNINLSPNITLQQHLSESNITLALSFEGQGWVGVGFNRNGNMIGSTVVIGFPDEPLTHDMNPGRYYLGAKEINRINRVDANGTKKGVEWPKPLQMNNIDSNNDNGDEEWRRSLYLPEAYHRLLSISDASIEQNSTHTTLQFTRPLESSDRYMTQVHPNDLNTLIWAVGSSNQFGYHGSQRGAHSINFTECLHGSLVSTSSLNGSLEVMEQEQIVDQVDVPEFVYSPAQADTDNSDMKSGKASSSGHMLGGFWNCIIILMLLYR